MAGDDPKRLFTNPTLTASTFNTVYTAPAATYTYIQSITMFGNGGNLSQHYDYRVLAADTTFMTVFSYNSGSFIGSAYFDAAITLNPGDALQINPYTSGGMAHIGFGIESS